MHRHDAGAGGLKSRSEGHRGWDDEPVTSETGAEMPRVRPSRRPPSGGRLSRHRRFIDQAGDGDTLSPLRVLALVDLHAYRLPRSSSRLVL